MIRLNNVSRFYPAKTEAAGGVIRALDDFTLRVESGEWIAVMGPSGSGKSTLVNLIGCLDSPSIGEIWLDGENVARLNTSELTRVRAEVVSTTKNKQVPWSNSSLLDRKSTRLNSSHSELSRMPSSA